MFGLGKKRTKFGRWLDRQGIKQIEIEKKANLGRATVSRLCNDTDYRPKYETVLKIKKALKQLGHDVPPDDYFGM
ncbi:helix-turn-helix domain-containing protein [Bacillus smithii]|uniref:helix-turn-helix domain-containing protein n=1 Tax=Bacillus smithii TaxID=1479 RepID=UPI003D19C014